jgi:hypothetical protein
VCVYGVVVMNTCGTITYLPTFPSSVGWVATMCVRAQTRARANRGGGGHATRSQVAPPSLARTRACVWCVHLVVCG